MKFVRQKRILNFIDNHNEKQAQLAKKEYKRFNLIDLLIILLIVFPLCTYIVLSLTKSLYSNSYPNGATKEKVGYISLYQNTFRYTIGSKRYEFSFDDYNLDNSYEPGDNILISLDDNTNIVSIAHKTENYELFVNIILAFLVSIITLLIHAFIGKKIYAKNWYLYVKWYEKEIEPYYYQQNFEEIVANKQYYDVTKTSKIS